MKILIKSAIILILTALSLAALSSCGFPWSRERSSGKRIVNTEVEQQKIAKSILKAFDEQDQEALKSLFCEKSQAIPELDEQIQAAMDFYEGKMVSYDDSSIWTSDGQRREAGIITRVTTGGRIRYIETDAGKHYTIAFSNHLVNKDDPDKVGISKLRIMYGDILDKNRSGEEVVVGEFYY